MQHRSEWVGGIDNESDIVLLTEPLHSFTVQRTIDTLSVMQGQLLLTCLRAVEVERSCLFQYLCSLSTFRRSSEYQYHAVG
jgi:hypothetical protein